MHDDEHTFSSHTGEEVVHGERGRHDPCKTVDDELARLAAMAGQPSSSSVAVNSRRAMEYMRAHVALKERVLRDLRAVKKDLSDAKRTGEDVDRYFQWDQQEQARGAHIRERGYVSGALRKLEALLSSLEQG